MPQGGLRVLLPLLLGCLLSCIPAAAMAASAGDARHFVDEVGSKVLGIVNAKGGSEAEREQRLQKLFSEHVDMPWMGRFVLGQYWQKATPPQRDRYMQAYEQYLLARYTTDFADYNGSKYAVTGVRDDGGGKFTVSMKIKTPQHAQDTLAGYSLQADSNGRFKIHDIIIEGVSLITTQRSEFAAVAQGKGIDGLIADIENKTKSAP